MVLKSKNLSYKTKKTGDIEVLQKNWELELDTELKELEVLEKEQVKKLKELEKEGVTSLDIFRLKQLEELQKSKNQKEVIEEQLSSFFEQLTGFKTLKKESEKLAQKIEDTKFVIEKMKKFQRNYFENEKKMLDIFDHVRELKAADIDLLRTELTQLDLLWEKWNYLKKEKVVKKIKDKSEVLSYIEDKSELEIERLKEFFKKLKGASRGKKSDEIYTELRKISEFKNLKTLEIREFLTKFNSELKNSSPKELEISLRNLREKEENLLTEIEMGFTKLRLIPQLVKLSM